MINRLHPDDFDRPHDQFSMSSSESSSDFEARLRQVRPTPADLNFERMLAAAKGPAPASSRTSAQTFRNWFPSLAGSWLLGATMGGAFMLVASQPSPSSLQQVATADQFPISRSLEISINEQGTKPVGQAPDSVRHDTHNVIFAPSPLQKTRLSWLTDSGEGAGVRGECCAAGIEPNIIGQEPALQMLAISVEQDRVLRVRPLPADLLNLGSTAHAGRTGALRGRASSPPSQNQPVDASVVVIPDSHSIPKTRAELMRELMNGSAHSLL